MKDIIHQIIVSHETKREIFQLFRDFKSLRYFIFKFLLCSIPGTLCLEVAKGFLRLSQHILPVSFSSFKVRVF